MLEIEKELLLRRVSFPFSPEGRLLFLLLELALSGGQGRDGLTIERSTSGTGSRLAEAPAVRRDRKEEIVSRDGFGILE
jgi:hypothetical protein